MKRSSRKIISAVKSQLGSHSSLDLDGHDQKAENEADAVKKAFAALVKALDDAHPHLDDPQKQIKKIPQHVFGSKLMSVTNECFPHQTGDERFNSGFGSLLSTYGRIQLDLGQLTSDYHKTIHQTVYTNLSASVQTSSDLIALERKKVQVAQAELDSCKRRYEQLQRKDDGTGKLEPARQAYEAARVDMKKASERYSIELDKFLSQDKQLGMPMVEMVAQQINYHKTAQMLLEQASKKLQKDFANLGGASNGSAPNRIFGGYLEDKTVSPFLLECCAAINRDGLKTEGVFRKQGSTTKIRTLRAAFTKGTASLASADAYDHDIHNVAALIKIYLRELVEPVMVSTFYDAWMESITVVDHEEKLYTMQTLVTQLPEGHFETLKFICKFAYNVAQYHKENKMSMTNLALVFGPNMLWPISDTSSGSLASDSQAVTMIVETLFTYAEWLFPTEDGDLDAATAEFPLWLEDLNDINEDDEDDVSTSNPQVETVVNAALARAASLKEAPKKKAPIAPGPKPSAPPGPKPILAAYENWGSKPPERPDSILERSKPPAQNVDCPSSLSVRRSKPPERPDSILERSKPPARPDSIVETPVGSNSNSDSSTPTTSTKHRYQNVDIKQQKPMPSTRTTTEETSNNDDDGPRPPRPRLPRNE